MPKPSIWQLFSILAGSFGINKFPAFCGIIVGGYNLLQIPLRAICSCSTDISARNSRKWGTTTGSRRFITKLLASFISAWISLRLLNPQGKTRKMNEELDGSASAAESPLSGPNGNVFCDPCPTAGRTIDLTLFVATRAADALVFAFWLKGSRFIKPSQSVISSILSRYTDTLVFAVSSGTIMWTWVYLPDRLPQEYNTWIGDVAKIDQRLIELLRKARIGDFVYGQDKGEGARVLQKMCKDYGWPLQWGDPEKTVPIPCEVVHMGTGPNCHWHAFVRFARAFRLALATNLPLQLLAKVLSRRRLSTKDVKQACKNAVRSSAFLGAFVALMYYAICLSRTRVGPRIFSYNTITPQMWDSGLCVRTACMLCGWSILIEAERRRQELAMFVAPKALAVYLPRQYGAKDFWKERAAFSLSTAILFTMSQEHPTTVRGMLGKLLGGILTP